MSRPDLLPAAVVVGIDGSKSALQAALWAMLEALDRNAPLRLVYAIEPGDATPFDPRRDARALASAEIAVKDAIVAIESAELPIKIEVEIRQRSGLQVLREQSRTAALLCVGDVGNDFATGNRLGSVSAGLADTAHCPVAVIRGEEPRGAVLVEAASAYDDDAVLELAVHHALLRKAPLQIASCPPASFQSRLDYWQRRYPDLQATTVSVEATLIDYVAQHAGQIQLVVTSRLRRGGLQELTGAAANAALHGTNCSLLICQERSAL
jgi:nucleotide-binding universal stress UspA family protein